MAATVVLVVAIGLTFAVSTVATKRRDARLDLQKLIAEARAAGGPQKVVTSLESYLGAADQPRGGAVRIATAALAEAKRAVDEADYHRIRELDTGEDADLDRLESTLRDYLSAHPQGVYRREVEGRLSLLPRNRDDQAFRRASKRAGLASDDVPKQKAAWESYLRKYPRGRGAAKARARVAELPEREDALRLARLKQEVDALVAAGRYTQALLRVDRGLTELRAPPRQQDLAEIGRRVESKLEVIDAARCLGPVGTGASKREKRLSECSLYLLSYPTGPNRGRIETRLRGLRKELLEEKAEQIRRKVAALNGDPGEALRIVAKSLRAGSIPASKLRDEVVRLHGAKFRRFLDGSLKDVKRILLKDGTELVGTVKSQSATPIQVELRPAAANGTPNVRLLTRTQIVSISDPPAKTEWDRIRQRWPKGQARELTAERFINNIRSLRNMFRGDKYRLEWEACQVLLAALSPADLEAQRAAAQLGFVEDDGVLLPAPPPSMAAAGAVDRRRMLERLAASFLSEAAGEAKGFLSRLPGSYEFTLYGTKLDVPVDWRLGTLATELKPTETGQSIGTIILQFPLTLARDTGMALPSSVAERVDDEIGDLNKNPQNKFEVEYEVRSVRSRRRGIGVQLENRDDAIVVEYVVPGTPAEVAGMLAGDRLYRVGDDWVEAGQRADAVAARFASSASRIALIVLREDRRFALEVEQGEYELVLSQSRRRVNVPAKVLGKRFSGRFWSEWANIEAVP